MVVVFDLDDTLYWEKDFVSEGIKAVIEEIAHKALLKRREAEHILESSSSVSEGFDALERTIANTNLCDCASGATPYTVADMLMAYRFCQPKLSLRPEALLLLEALSTHHIPMALITDGRGLTQRNKIKALHLDRFIPEPFWLISDEIGYDKLSKQPFKWLMSLFPMEADFVYVGDNPRKDFIWPNRLGWTTFMILNPDGSSVHSQKIELAEEYSAQHCVTFPELQAALLAKKQ